MKRKLLMTILTGGALIGSLTLSNAVAGPWFGDCDSSDHMARQERMSERMDRHLDRMTILLDLNTTQQEQIRKILSAKQERHREQFQEHRDERKQMRKMDSAVAFDEAAFRALAEKRAARRIDRQVEQMKTRKRILALLTPEQQKKAEILFQAMGAHGHGHGPGMRPSPDADEL